MKIRPARWAIRMIAMTVAVAAVTLPRAAAEPMGTSFIYQGQLKMGGVPVDGQADLQFKLYDAETEGTLIDTFGASFVDVVDGLFSVELDFGAAEFSGDARWLEIRVEFPSGESNWTTLSPRQPVMAAPYALHALNGGESLWSAAGSDIYYDAGSVGIGEVNPVAGLHVDGAADDAVYATATAADAVALRASSSGDAQVAIEADATGTALDGGNPAPNTAGKFYASGEGSVGVYGHVGEGRYGVHGRSDSQYGSGVFGEATSSGDTTGVKGKSASTRGRGVWGDATASTGQTSGVYGSADSPDGVGVYGLGNATSGNSIGVRGRTRSSDGYAAYFTGGRNYFEGNLGIGTSDPGSMLHIVGPNDPIDGPILTLQASALNGVESGRIRLMESTGNMRGGFIHYDGLNNRLHIGTHAAANSDPADDVNAISVSRVTGAVGIGLDSPLWPLHVAGEGYFEDRVGVGGPSAGPQLHVHGDTTLDGLVTVGDTPVGGASLGVVSSNVYGVKANITEYLGAAIAGEATYSDTNGIANGVMGSTASPGGAGVYGSGKKAGVEGVSSTVDGSGVYGHHNSAGIGVQGKANSSSGYGGYFTNTGGNALYASSTGSGRNNATLRVHNTQLNAGMAAYITNAGTYATMHAQNNGPGEVLWLARNDLEGEFIVAYNERSGGRVFTVDQDGWTKVSVLEITGGADLSEQFDVTSEGAVVEPGMVVCIDAENPGKLVVADRPYDYTVAGVVSGAGGVKPGMLMGQQGTVADGQHPIALTGRVWTWCDSSNGAIKPGDLLTTSSVPGHAMKVTDRTRAQGAMIGKAMTSLSEGTGLVLVLVSLQ